MLASITEAAATLTAISNALVELNVVDNSTDATVAVSQESGARVIGEPRQGISRARNAGACHSTGDALVFVDACVTVPPGPLTTVHVAMTDPGCAGGGVDVAYRPRRRSMRLYLMAWRFLALRLGMVQGATQFCGRSTFEAIGGYYETAWTGEDVDFYWAMRRLARRSGASVSLLRSPSCRPPPDDSTTGRSGRRCSGPTPSSSP